MLRPYQQRAIDDLYQWFTRNPSGHPCLVLPTGSGKSHIVAALCKDALQSWPSTKILMLTHQKELIEQNAEKLRQHWKGAPMGIYSASVGKKQLGEPITFAGIQSIRNKAAQVGHIDLCIIDECHLVSHKDEGGYRTFISELIEINPSLRVVGLTATPHRLGHGLITDKPALFDDLLESVTIEELVRLGYLSTLRSKITTAKLLTEGVHKRGGEYIESELQAAVDTSDNNTAVVSEIVRLGADRKSWILFCAGVQHAEHIRDALIERGIVAECVTGQTSKPERERILSEFKAGRIRALTNANVLTTGFDAPNVDLIAMLRPTMSASLYVQMAGRGMRVCEGKTDCLVLDFAGVVEQHGAIINVRPPVKGGDGGGEAPTKGCEQCGEIVHAAARTCSACGFEFPEPVKAALVLRNDDIMGINGRTLEVTSWRWRKHTSRTSGVDMLAVTYYGGLSDPSVTEYFPVLHDGWAGQKAIRALVSIAHSSGAYLADDRDLTETAAALTNARAPAEIEYFKDGKFYRVKQRSWNYDNEHTTTATG
jgi:DNA repair protein RadD